jgi:hypothetical protein
VLKGFENTYHLMATKFVPGNVQLFDVVVMGNVIDQNIRLPF